MPCIAHCCAIFWEGVECVARNEPGGLYLVFVEEFQKTPCAFCTCPKTCEPLKMICRMQRPILTSANVARRIFSSVRSKPASNGVDIDTIAYEDALFAHSNYRVNI